MIDTLNYNEFLFGDVLINQKKDLPSLKYSYLLKAINKSEPKKILEIGCGSGKYLASIKRDIISDCNLVGIDLSNAAVLNGKSLFPDIDFFCGNAEQLPFEDNSFDFIFFMDLLEHVYNPEEVFREAKRVLIPDGFLHMFIPCEGHGIYKAGNILLKYHVKQKVIGHINRFTRKDIFTLIGSEMSIVDAFYTYHFLGSMMDFIFFLLLLNKRINNIYWSKNKYYRSNINLSKFERIFNSLMSICNKIAFMESTLLKKVAFGSTGIHITAHV